MYSKFEKSNKNRNSRDNGSRNFVPRESKRKVVRHDGLLVLSVDGNNLI
jgi:hypothetical protein